MHRCELVRAIINTQISHARTDTHVPILRQYWAVRKINASRITGIQFADLVRCSAFTRRRAVAITSNCSYNLQHMRGRTREKITGGITKEKGSAAWRSALCDAASLLRSLLPIFNGQYSICLFSHSKQTALAGCVLRICYYSDFCTTLESS